MITQQNKTMLFMFLTNITDRAQLSAVLQKSTALVPDLLPDKSSCVIDSISSDIVSDIITLNNVEYVFGCIHVSFMELTTMDLYHNIPLVLFGTISDKDFPALDGETVDMLIGLQCMYTGLYSREFPAVEALSVRLVLPASIGATIDYLSITAQSTILLSFKDGILSGKEPLSSSRLLECAEAVMISTERFVKLQFLVENAGFEFPVTAVQKHLTNHLHVNAAETCPALVHVLSLEPNAKLRSSITVDEAEQLLPTMLDTVHIITASGRNTSAEASELMEFYTAFVSMLLNCIKTRTDMIVDTI